MEGEAPANAFEQDPANWYIYKNAFVAPSLPRSKPWERASVSAHAPRLHGHKIWKRAPSKPKHNDNKENDEVSQLELETEGAGARKRARLRGGKEYIYEAPWQPLSDVGHETAEGWKDALGPNKQGAQSTAMVTESPDKLRVIPRKRTNANHLITPRKHSRRIPMKDVTHPPDATLRMSPRKWSPIVLIEGGDPPMKLPLNDVQPADSPNKVTTGSPKKCIRRRSLRQSSRRLTTTEFAVPKFDSVECLEALESAPDIAIPSNNQAETKIRPISPSVGDNNKDEDSTPTVESLNEHGRASELLVSSNQSKNVTVEAGTPTRKKEQHGDELEDMLGELLQTDPMGHALHQEVIKQDFSEQLLVTDAESGPLRSTDKPSNVVLSPTKASDTSDSPKRSNSKLRGSRRSTRSTRGSVLAPDVHHTETKQPERTCEKEVQITLSNPEAGQFSVPVLKNGHVACTLQEAQETDVAVINDSAGQQIEHIKEQVSADILTETISHSAIQHSAPTPCNSGVPSPFDFSSRSLERSGNSSEELEAPRSVLESQESALFHTEASFEDEVTTPEMGMATAALFKSNGDADDEVTLEINAFSAETKPDDDEDAHLEVIEPISMATVTNNLLDNTATESEDLHESSTPDPSTTELVEAISENALPATYDHDDTDLLRSFLSRVKANKEAKARTTSKRKQSFPHSPLRIPLGEDAINASPSPIVRDEFDVSLPSPTPRKRSGNRNDAPTDDEDETEPRSVRRSGRTRLPVKATAPAPSFIPVRRLGPDGDNTLTLKRNEDKELAALTRVNTRKNKAGASHPLEVLISLEIEKHDPAARQRALKEKFDEKFHGAKSKKGKNVVWAEEIAQYQSAEEETKKEPEKDKEKPPGDEKKGAVRVGVRSSRISLGMAMNGTPAPKRKVKVRP